MSDLYHRDVPLSFIAKVFGVMHQINWHRYQILTKRAERLGVGTGSGMQGTGGFASKTSGTG